MADDRGQRSVYSIDTSYVMRCDAKPSYTVLD
jgi:hypothetical protein